MLNRLSVLNKVYPQSRIDDNGVKDCIPNIMQPVYMVLMKAPYFETPDVYFFDNLDTALSAIRDRHQAYDHLEFEVKRFTRFDDDDSISISQDIFYEF